MAVQNMALMKLIFLRPQFLDTKPQYLVGEKIRHMVFFK